MKHLRASSSCFCSAGHETDYSSAPTYEQKEAKLSVTPDSNKGAFHQANNKACGRTFASLLER
jgi:hypothetical protein